MVTAFTQTGTVVNSVLTVTTTDVANLVLNSLGLEQITDIATDTTTKGVTLRRHWAPVLKSLLRSHPWKFALKRVALVNSGLTPAFGFTYAYTMPADCLRVLTSEYEQDDIKIEGRYILSDVTPLEIRHIYYEDDPSLWDSAFVACFAARMAAETALALTEDAGKQKANLELYAYKLREAKLADGQEGKPREMTFNALTEVR